MSAQLGPPLIQLFAPRPPIRYVAPSDTAPEQRRTTKITGIAEYVSLFGQHDQEYKGSETFEESKKRRREEKKQRHETAIKMGLEDYNPNEDTQVRGDPYKTLFISRLAYDVTEDDLQREFGRYGAIERVRIVRNTKDEKPRGYAFLVFEREKDMKAAYKDTDGMRIKDRRILVDVERGRTVKGWKPMRLGGGLGGRKKSDKTALSARPADYRGPARPYNDRGPAVAPRASTYGSRDEGSRDRSAPRQDRQSDRPDRYDRSDRGERSDRYDRSDRSDRHDRGDRSYGQAPRAYEPPPHSDRPRQGRQGIGFDRPSDPRAGPSRSFPDSHIGFSPASSQPPLDPRARQPPTTYSTVPSAPSAPWLAHGQASSSSTSRERPAYDEDRDTKRRRY
ncbi:U1 small nuclear ribonucleoprotein 70 kDa [Taphrina deformans PYCC 5710]|uniref:U1 small nuclear ribonucleoprotein 70 kDa n=1 Tax=Taphrina deformans (strain PYCC 5710 / ATCC 11124 / CBS 356.35 / IMI 108563 / JCM 9778 / NBRC 8474) TaxID=1097556 RepID=R4XCL7_TAPDE|nr:U1 small nuclear ribonucleoprotein 70 kDa [Taphrina deformans PYCC 5710]|eukprot:CCG81040.2 U1 small nuclear ribonucleoprotein 70 kDa [Taphrina deformans PYCC 5710]